jgi:ribonuclease HII
MPGRIDPALIPAAPDLSFESALWAQGLVRIAGLDEAGRGAWAGPVAAAAVILPNDINIQRELTGVRDSKQVRAERRAELALAIESCALACCCGFAGNDEIDTLGIVPATRLAMQRALAGLQESASAQHLLIDALFLPDVGVPQSSLIKGDQRSLSIAAASILAKHNRDELMRELDQKYPGYGFARHKGYGTQAHQLALEKFGITPIHRMSFAPLKEIEPD